MDQLEERIAKIEARNRKVETDKAWETSLMRKVLIALFTYLAIALYFQFVIKIDPWIHAIVPTLGFLLSTLTMPFFKNLWIKIIYKKKWIDKIAADVNLHYFNSKPTFPGSLSDILKIVLLPTREGPTAIFKYIVAALVLISSIILGFMSFGRTAAKGVEALGRNPAASKIIHLGIIFNVAIVVIIILAGLTVAFLILRL